ncbi:MAG: NAD-dependent epimerase/dehydratase family protein [Gammaproteobacteria bacterium]|nr:NAD-dependent epimerase/dehydratase family protein [Gammaproteobacteria bacterium]
MAYYDFTRRIAGGEPISLYNGGHLQRDFTWIDDAVECIARIHARPPDGWSVYNIGGGHRVELLDFVGVLEQALGRRAIIRHEPMMPGDVHATLADTGALQRDYGYTPQTPIETGLPRFMEWWRGCC